MQKTAILFNLFLVLSLMACSVFDRPDAPLETEVKPIPKASDDSKQSTEILPGITIPSASQSQVKPKPHTKDSETLVTSGKEKVREPVAVAKPVEATEPVKVTKPVEKQRGGEVTPDHDPTIDLCSEVGKKLGSITVKDCLDRNLVHSGYTNANRSLAFKDYPPLPERDPLGRVLVIGGIHGDEFSSVSVVIKWMMILDQHHSGLFHWRFLPTVNPDGLLNSTSQRQNLNGVDLNRNFPTADWERNALSYWEHKTHRNPRRHPGPEQASEPETKWLVNQINEFEPDVIISMHAPYHLVDYDGPPSPPGRLGGLYLRRLGVYPGSLGNYAGIDLQMPIITVELKSAGIMPSRQEVDAMWLDLVRWLGVQLSG